MEGRDSNPGLPDPKALVIHTQPHPRREACFLKPDPAVNASPSRESVRGSPAECQSLEGGCSRATELFNPTFLHYIGIPYVHFSFLTSRVNTCLPKWRVLTRSTFLYKPRWGQDHPGGLEGSRHLRGASTVEGLETAKHFPRSRPRGLILAQVEVSLARPLLEARTFAHIHPCLCSAVHLFWQQTFIELLLCLQTLINHKDPFPCFYLSGTTLPRHHLI